ncbi:glycoside hydrolase family protein [Yokenella regensburgei]|jgi:hypothetical protein|uniref:glycoside hydrolase family protein n=1 Tax=Yokenella regensburgei TaxID=158877 RepID=UPI003CC921DB
MAPLPLSGRRRRWAVCDGYIGNGIRHGYRYTDKECDNLLNADLRKVANAIDPLIKARIPEPTPIWSKDSDGNICLSGILDWPRESAPVNGAVFYTLQPSAMLVKSLRLVGQFDGGICLIIVDTSGDISEFGMTSGTWITLHIISFKGVI